MLKRIITTIALLVLAAMALPRVSATGGGDPTPPPAFSDIATLSFEVCKAIDADGNPVGFPDDAAISRDEHVELYFAYKIKQGFTASAPYTYTFSIEGPLKNVDGDFEVNYDGVLAFSGKITKVASEDKWNVTITYTEKGYDFELLNPDATGDFYFGANFNDGEIDNAGSQHVTVKAGGVESSPKYNFKVDDVTASAPPVKSVGAIDLVNREIPWQITAAPSIENATANLSNPADPTGNSDLKLLTWVISDTLEAEKVAGGLTYVDGSLALSPEVSGAQLSYDAPTRTVKCIFPENFKIDKIDEANPQTYTLSYKTAFSLAEIAARLDRDNNAVFKNTATSDITFPKYIKDPVSGEAKLDTTPSSQSKTSDEVKATINGAEFKKNGYPEGSDRQKWVLTVKNSLELARPQLKDTLPLYLSIVTDTAGNPAVYSGDAVLAANRLPQTSPATAGRASYSYDAATRELLINIAPGTAEQKFCYETHTETGYTGGTITNSADFTWDETGTGPRQVFAHKTASVMQGGYYMTKVGHFDDTSHTITWSVKVDPAKLSGLSDVKFVDTIPSDQSYYETEPVLVNGGGTATLNANKTELTVDYSASGTALLDADTPAFTYKTLVNDNSRWAMNKTSSSNNKVVIKAAELPEAGYPLNVSTPVRSEVLAKTHVGSYDHVNHTLSWQVSVNHNEMKMTNAVLEDTVPQGWSFERSSIVVKRTDGTVEDAVELSFPSAAVMRVSLPDMARRIPGQTQQNKPYYVITYKTKLVDPALLLSNPDWDVTNTAKLTASEMPLNGQTVSATQRIHAPMLTKELANTADDAKNSGFLTWRVIINQGLTTVGATGGGSSPVLIDRLEPNLALDIESVSLCRMNVDADGGLSDGEELTRGRDYDVRYNSLEREMRVDFKHRTISSAYKLTFNTDFVALIDADYKNTVFFEGLDSPQNTATSGVAEMDFRGGRATPLRSYGSLRVSKTDAEGQALEGAVFTLTRHGSTAAEATAVSDINGVAEFFVPTGAYTLTEIKAPPGYVAARSQRVDIAQNTTVELTVVNSKIPPAGRANPSTGFE